MANEETAAPPITHEGSTFHHVSTGHKGKKAGQVAAILEQLQENPGVPMDFDEMCLNAGAKYPQDVQAAMMALEMCELVNLYVKGGSKKAYYVWTAEVESE